MTADIRVGRLERMGMEPTVVQIVDREEGYPPDHDRVDIEYFEIESKKTAES